MYVQRGTQRILVDLLKNPRGAEVLRDYLLEMHPGTPIAVRLQSYRTEVAAILSAVGPVSFGDAIPDAPFVTVAGPYINDLIGPQAPDGIAPANMLTPRGAVG